MIFDKDGTSINIAYEKDGTIVSNLYDVDGNLLVDDAFADSTTVSNVYTSTLTAQPQGGCMDSSGNIYTCFYGAGRFSKYNIASGTETIYNFTPNAYGHANGMTYNPNTGYLYIASMNATGEVYVLDTSLNLVDTLYAKDENGAAFTCWNIAYNRTAERFITMVSSDGGKIYFMDDDFEFINSVSFTATEWANTRQDIETDGTYIYCVSYSSNNLYVFDMSGTFIKAISNSAFTGEPESLIYDWTNNVFYIEGKSTYYVIRSIEFRAS